MKSIAFAGSLAVALSGGAAQAQAVHGARMEALLGLEMRSPGAGIKQDSRPVFGARLGYDLPVVRRLSLGVDAEVSGFGHDGDDRFAALTFVTPAPVPHEFVYRSHTGRNFYAGARATYAVTSAIGMFAGVGYSSQRVNACLFNVLAGDCPSPSVAAAGPPIGLVPAPATLPHDLAGVRFGGGVPVSLTRHLFTTVEYTCFLWRRQRRHTRGRRSAHRSVWVCPPLRTHRSGCRGHGLAVLNRGFIPLRAPAAAVRP